MTEIYLEVAGKKAIVWSLEWPGWCRIRSSEAAAVQALRDTTPRDHVIAERAGLAFTPGDLVVVERLPGDATTAWGYRRCWHQVSPTPSSQLGHSATSPSCGRRGICWTSRGRLTPRATQRPA
jgi:hypothetical protein